MAEWTVEAQLPVPLPGRDREIVAVADEAEADTVARDLSSRPDLMKAVVYRDGEPFAEYGFGFKWERGWRNG